MTHFFLHAWNIGATILWYFFLKNRIRYLEDKQSPRVILGFFVAGCLSIPLTYLFHFIHPFHYLFPGILEMEFFYQVFITGLTEEWAKWICFYMAVRGGGTIKEPQDGILQAAAVGLGFGVIENISYINRYPELFIAVRPLLTTGGHMIYAAFWGYFFSAAVYANARSRDPRSYRNAVISVFVIAVVHGMYNSLLSFSILFIAVLPKLIILLLSIAYFLRMVATSPYRAFPLHQANKAVEAIRTGLIFNRTSPILNRRMGIFLMRLGRYNQSAVHFARAMPKLKNRKPLKFLRSVAEYAVLRGTPGKKALRKAWSGLTDKGRTRMLKELEVILKNDQDLFAEVKGFLLSPFSERKGKDGHALARELKERKARRRYEKRISLPLPKE
jgi:RsiW-degrading membrane proteinase PrsW (M82 family)